MTIKPTTISNTGPDKRNGVFLGLYAPEEIKSQLSQAAKEDRRSVSSLAVLIFEDFLKKRKA